VTCWDKSPDVRFSFLKIVKILKKHLSKTPKTEVGDVDPNERILELEKELAEMRNKAAAIQGTEKSDKNEH